MRGWFAALLLALALPGAALAQTDATARLRSDLGALTAGLGRAAVLVVSLDQGDTLFAAHADRPLVPASNQKLLTTAAALLLLGPDFRYSTYLLADGQVRNGVLLGNLILYGTGDPTLGSRALPNRGLDLLADSLAALGVREVRGDLVGDGSFWDADWTPNAWDPAHLSQAYGAPVGGLNFAENLNGGSPVRNPVRFASEAFRWTLARRGIRVTGDIRTVTDPTESRVGFAGVERSAPARPLAVVQGPRLAEIVRVTNQQSHNAFAEALLKTVGRVALGDGSFAGGARATRMLLARELGVDTTGTYTADGSGLARLDRVSASTTVGVLAGMARSELAPVWEASLPVAAGPAGTLRGRMGGTSAAGNLRAKTGTIRWVSSLSGYVRTADGERLAFSILVNDVADTGRAKAVENRIGARLAQFRREAALSPVGRPVSWRDRPAVHAAR